MCYSIVNCTLTLWEPAQNYSSSPQRDQCLSLSLLQPGGGGERQNIYSWVHKQGSVFITTRIATWAWLIPLPGNLFHNDILYHTTLVLLLITQVTKGTWHQSQLMYWLFNLFYWSTFGTMGTYCYAAGSRRTQVMQFHAASALSLVHRNNTSWSGLIRHWLSSLTSTRRDCWIDKKATKRPCLANGMYFCFQIWSINSVSACYFIVMEAGECSSWYPRQNGVQTATAHPCIFSPLNLYFSQLGVIFISGVFPQCCDEWNVCHIYEHPYN